MARARTLDSSFKAELQSFVDIVSELAYEMTWAELARQSSLSTQCIYNLLSGITQSPHARTIFKLGRAVGLDISFTNKKIKLRVAA